MMGGSTGWTVACRNEISERPHSTPSACGTAGLGPGMWYLLWKSPLLPAAATLEGAEKAKYSTYYHQVTQGIQGMLASSSTGMAPVPLTALLRAVLSLSPASSSLGSGCRMGACGWRRTLSGGRPPSYRRVRLRGKKEALASMAAKDAGVALMGVAAFVAGQRVVALVSDRKLALPKQ